MINIYSIPDPQHGSDIQGTNPLVHRTVNRNGVSVPLSRVYDTYDWVGAAGYANLPTWIEDAASAVGR